MMQDRGIAILLALVDILGSQMRKGLCDLRSRDMSRQTKLCLFEGKTGVVEGDVAEESGLVEAGKVFPFGLHLVGWLFVGVEVERAGGHFVLKRSSMDDLYVWL